MRPTETDHVFELMEGYVPSAALNAALECGLFWGLAGQGRSVGELSLELGIPSARTRHWVDILCDQGLLVRDGESVRTSEVAHRIILGRYSRETWQALASLARERMPVILDLPGRLRDPRSTWEAQGTAAPNYFRHISQDLGTAHAYTRMLHEIHVPMAAVVADQLPLGRGARVLDLGGGSGVVAMALVRRWEGASAVVADIPNVCDAGRALVAQHGLSDRVGFLEIDFHRDPVPGQFDVVIMCDTGPYTSELFAKVRAALVPAGRFAIVEQLPGDDPPDERARQWFTWSFRSALQDRTFRLPAAGDFSELLAKADLVIRSSQRLPARDAIRWDMGWTLLQGTARAVGEPIPPHGGGAG